MPAQSHLNPTLGVVKELIQQGHQVIVYNTSDFEKKIIDVGAEFRSYQLTMKELQSGQGKNPLDLVTFILKHAKQLVPQLLEEVKREQPDCIIHDSLNLWGKIIGKKTNLPTVCFSPTFIMTPQILLDDRDHLYTDLWNFLSHPVAVLKTVYNFRSLYKSQGLQPPLSKDIVANIEQLTIVFTSQEFQPGGNSFPDTFQFVGPILYDRKETSNSLSLEAISQPIIYLALGTIYPVSKEFYSSWIHFFATQQYQVFISVGKAHDPQTFGTLPAHIMVSNFLPQLEILTRASVFITHGGMNSINESLYHGVPMMIFPQIHEQKINALRLQELGAGIFPNKHLNQTEMGQLIHRLLTDTTYKENAQKIGQTLKDAGGAKKAVELILQFISAKNLR